ncbi:uncharacterized protein LOC143027903 [Oratosquilla oratoria]|uniref:uncharacterized protein LOC143027903 n=1 Tax=Oratosquilla oratoria TaxID=337810 RepID=UPI003F757E01
MGSPLGVLFAQAFMPAVEEAVFQDDNIKPQLYCRYIDDIFVCTQSNVLLENLRLHLQEESGLSFTIELNKDGILPFLDVLVDSSSREFATSVYRKPTNSEKV